MSTPTLAFDGLNDTPAPPTGFGHKARAHCRLGLMIILSLLGHAATFYVFQVAYTPASSLLPPPARVVLVPLDRPENASFARWLSLADPTSTIQPDSPASASATVADFPGLRYQPSYEAMHPAFKPLDSSVSSEGIAAPPRPFVPGPVAMTDELPGKTVASAETISIPAAGPTRVMLTGNLRERVSLPLPPVRFSGGAALKPTEPSVFLVGVRTDGSERFLFPVRQAPTNSGSTNAEEADEVARGYLARLAFRPAATSGEDIVWGKAIFYWGGDLSSILP